MRTHLPPGAHGAAFLATLVVSLVGASTASAQCASMGSHAGHESVEAHHEDGLAYRSPGLAVALSLTPMPVDFGNL